MNNEPKMKTEHLLIKVTSEDKPAAQRSREETTVAVGSTVIAVSSIALIWFSYFRWSKKLDALTDEREQLEADKRQALKRV